MLTRREMIKLLSATALSSLTGCSLKIQHYTDFITGEGFRVYVEKNGIIQVEIGKDFYSIESFYSYPKNQFLGLNAFSRNMSSAEKIWHPKIISTLGNKVCIVAHSNFYILKRTILVFPHRVVITDSLTNNTNNDIGILISHLIRTQELPYEVLLGGTPQNAITLSAENPTIFITLKNSRLGIVAEDTLSRLQFEAMAQNNVITFAFKHLAISSRRHYEQKWTLYPLLSDADYFTFINKIRNYWNVNFKVQGPFSFFNIIEHWKTLQNPEKLKVYLRGTRLKVVAFLPWLDYDNFNYRTGKIISRSEYKLTVQEAIAAIKSIDSSIKCLGCMELNLIPLPSKISNLLYEALPKNKRIQGIYPFTNKQMQIIKHIPLRCKDSLIVSPSGHYLYELYYRGPKRTPLMAIVVYPAPGNTHSLYLMEQVQFLIEKVGLDGVYIDQFNLAFSIEQRYSYEKWDGITVDIDNHTGNIRRRYTDGAFVSVHVRKQLITYVLSKNGIVVANTLPAAKEIQAVPIMRFMETHALFDPLTIEEGQEPPLQGPMCKGHLGSPIALGYIFQKDKTITPQAIMKSIITSLRHGLLYYHYLTQIPVSNSNNNIYEVISHMFPITPIGLHKGWIEGRERIITAISGIYKWRHPHKPKVYCFDITGRKTYLSFSIIAADYGWKIVTKLKDWSYIVTIE